LKPTAIATILTDSDLDGIMCGTMLRTVYPDAQIVVADPVSMQTGVYDEQVDAKTVIADLSYVEGVGLYFDHHESNRPDHDNFDGRWAAEDSAAHVVYDYYKDSVDLSRFIDLIPDVDLLDMAEFSLEQFREPSEVLRLGLAIDRDDRAFIHLVIELLAAKGWDFVYAHEQVQKRLRQHDDAKKAVQEYIKSHITIEDNIGVIEMDDLAVDVRTSSFEFTSLFPELDALLVVKPHPKQGFKITYYNNSFKSDRIDYDLLAVATALNPESSGGHRGACGFVPLPGQTRQDAIRKSLQLLVKQRSEV